MSASISDFQSMVENAVKTQLGNLLEPVSQGQEELTTKVNELCSRLPDLCAAIETITKYASAEPREVELTEKHFAILIQHAKEDCKEPNCKIKNLWNEELRNAVQTTKYQCAQCGSPLLGIDSLEKLLAFEKCPSCGSTKAEPIGGRNAT